MALAQKGDRHGRPAACMALHGNVSILLVISKAVRLLTLGVFVSVILTVSSLLVPPYCKKKVGGCTISLTPCSRNGEDRSALPGVADIACLYGECIVCRCLPGYQLARTTAVAVSVSTLILMMGKTYPRVSTNSNTFLSGGTERSSKIPTCL